MSFGWEGEKARLVPLDRDRHLENCYRWLNDPEVTEFLAIGDFPLSRLAEVDFFDRMEKSGETDIVFAIETLNGKHIGMSGIHQISYRHGRGTTGTFIGDKDFWNKGFGTDSARIRTKYAFEVVGLRLLVSGVYGSNLRSLAMLKRAGYVEAGRIPRYWWKRGKWEDEVLMVAERP
jgi:RimJ/RimL family protein N-acetyltransferase